MENTTISIVNTIGDSYGIQSEDGQKVFELIKKAIDYGYKVTLSFINIEMLTTAFLNMAIGQLYKDYSEDKIKTHLHVADISESGKIALKRVVDTAKIYYKDPDALQKSIDDIIKE
jgi:hypothetical protein